MKKAVVETGMKKTKTVEEVQEEFAKVRALSAWTPLARRVEPANASNQQIAFNQLTRSATHYLPPPNPQQALRSEPISLPSPRRVGLLAC